MWFLTTIIAAHSAPIILSPCHFATSPLRNFLGIVSRMANYDDGRMENGRWKIVALLLLLLGGCLLVAGFGMRVYSQRTQSPADFGLQIPTIATTQEVVPTRQSSPQAAATVTLRATPTLVVLGTTSADFAIVRTGEDLFSADSSAWATINGISPTHIVEREATWDGSRDGNAFWQMAYDNAYLYGFVTVQDDVIAQTETPRKAYLGDSLEMELDTFNDKAARAQADDYQFILSPGNFGDVAAGIYRFRGDGTNMGDSGGFSAEITAQKSADGYTLRFRIPWRDLNLTAPPLSMGIALNLNDNDSIGVPKQELMLSSAATRRWSQPATWGTVTLER